MAKISIKVKIKDQKLFEIRDTFVRFKGGKAGFFDGQSYPNGLTVAANAAIHNFGTKTIPARPFMDEAAQAFEQAEPQVAMIYKRALENSDASIANQRVGALYAQKIRESIRKGSFQSLKKETIERKGSSKPLIDTGLLIGSVSFKEN